MQQPFDKKECLYYRIAQDGRREIRMREREAEVMQLKKKGYKVSKIASGQYRINNRVDVYPLHQEYKNLGSGRLCKYKNLKDVLDKIK